MVVSYLGTTDLTRALAVSRVWQQSILGAGELRRTLFLASRWTVEDHFEWEQRSIVHEPSKTSKPVVQPHPVLRHNDSAFDNFKTYARLRSCQSISPSTLLSQPPPTKVIITHHFYSTYACCEKGLTFGHIVSALEETHARRDRIRFDHGRSTDSCLDFQDDGNSFRREVKTMKDFHKDDDVTGDDYARYRAYMCMKRRDDEIVLVSYHGVAENTQCVKLARGEVKDERQSPISIEITDDDDDGILRLGG
jgi:hypothetical protein